MTAGRWGALVVAVSLLGVGAPARAAGPDPAWPGPYVGAHASQPNMYNSGDLWRNAQVVAGDGKLTYRRLFDKTIPDVGVEAWRRVPTPANFYSVKPPDNDYKGFIAGKYHEQLRAMARELPVGTKFTMYHEPEAFMSGTDFYEMFRRMRDIVKLERPTGVEIWYVAHAYQWRTNSKGNVGSAKGWLDAARLADAVGIDIYAHDWYFQPLEKDEGLARWRKLVAAPSGKKWGVVERGITAKKGVEARHEMLKSDWDFVCRHGADLFLYWHSDLEGDWTLTGPGELAFYKSLAQKGRPFKPRPR